MQEESDDVIDADGGEKDFLFGLLRAGLQSDGTVLDDLGWAAFHITEQTGIESTIGLSGFCDELSFMASIQSQVGAKLGSWEPCQLDLFRCWYRPLAEQFPASNYDPSDSLFCYAAWRTFCDPQAIKATKTRVFALRHKAWRLLQDGRIKAFHCARQRSYAEEHWGKTNPGRPVIPEIMRGFTDVGFYLTGTDRGSNSESRLTWPTPSLNDTLADADRFSAHGVENLCLCEGGVGYRLADLAHDKIERLRNAHARHGEEMSLGDLASVARIR